MQKSKDYFLELSEQGVAQMFPSTYTKREAVTAGESFVQKILDEGNVGKHEIMANIIRLKTFFDTVSDALRYHLPFEKVNVNGVEFTPVNGGSTPNYKEDPDWVELQKKLKDREELVKLASKSNDEIYDQNGVLVKKVSSSERKSSITLKF